MKLLRSLAVVVILFIVAAATALAGAEPAPWWQQVEETQGLLLKWISALSITFTALIGVVFTLWALINSKLKDVRDRQDRAHVERVAMTTQVVDLAKQLPPSGPAGPVLCWMAAACCASLFLSSCAGSGANGAWTASDSEVTARALSSIYGTGSQIYRDYRSGYQSPAAPYGSQP